MLVLLFVSPVLMDAEASGHCRQRFVRDAELRLGVAGRQAFHLAGPLDHSPVVSGQRWVHWRQRSDGSSAQQVPAVAQPLPIGGFP